MEFALVLPIFLALVVSIFDIGHLVWARNALENAAREAARYAIVHGGSATTACPVGPDQRDRTCLPSGSPTTGAVAAIARDWAIGVASSVDVTVCYGEGCSGSATASGVTNARGTPVTVRVSADVPLIIPGILSMFNGSPALSSFNLGSTVTMLVNS